MCKIRNTLVTLCAVCCIAASAQWSSDPAENLLCRYDDDSYNYSELVMGTNGISWLHIIHPGGENGCATRVMAVDSLGNKLFGEEGLLVSNHPNRSWISYNKCLFVDRDGNAIVLVNDSRHTPTDTVVTTGSPYGMTYYQSGIFGAGSGLCSYTAYKISPHGEMLWGEEGISIDGGASHTLTCGIHTIQLEDGSYVFAWSRANGSAMVIELSRISSDGELLWSPGAVTLSDPDMKVNYRDAYLVNAGFNQFILVYTKGANQDLYARKIDFDGTSVWSEDTRIYHSGWGSIPLWTILDVQPSGDGGVILSWNDDRSHTGIESAYIAYVKPNGTLGFTGDSDGVKLGYSNYRTLTVKCLYEPSTDSFIACWRECNQGQTYYRMVAQRISKEGELMWGENGLELEEYELTNFAYNSIQSGAEGDVAFFYMKNNGDDTRNVDACVTLRKAVTGEAVWSEPSYFYTRCDVSTEKSGLLSTGMYKDNFWVTRWNATVPKDNGEYARCIYMQRINNDRTIGKPADTAVEQYKNTDNTFVALATVVNNDAMFATNMSQATQATLTIHNVNGSLVATPFDGVLAAGKQYIEWNANVPAGIYFATLTTPQGAETVKLLVE